jgi:hypothetical protein
MTPTPTLVVPKKGKGIKTGIKTITAKILRVQLFRFPLRMPSLVKHQEKEKEQLHAHLKCQKEFPPVVVL